MGTLTSPLRRKTSAASEKRLRAAAPFVAAALLILASFGSASAGPVIIDGTDANDHGFFGSGANQDGWFYMQRSLENLGSQVAPSAARVVVTLGTDPGSTARQAIDSAFSRSALAAAGWTIQHINGEAAIQTYLASVSASNTGILYIPTQGNAGGDLTNAEAAVINASGAQIANYVGGAGNATLGGGLFSQSQSYGWLTSVIPGISVVDASGSGISLTLDGVAAFPGLTNADLSAGPWHNYFEGNFGSLSVLATSNFGGVNRALILGGGAGTIISPVPPSAVPEPTTMILLGTGLAGIAAKVRRRRGSLAADED